MNWVEYKLENDSVIKVPYNRCDVAPITKKNLEQLIKVVNASMRQAKILEYIKTNYADRMREQYQQGRADKYQEIVSEHMLLTEEQVAEIRSDAIDECINKLNEYASIPQLISAISFLIGVLENLKEQESDK